MFTQSAIGLQLYTLWTPNKKKLLHIPTMDGGVSNISKDKYWVISPPSVYNIHTPPYVMFSYCTVPLYLIITIHMSL